MNSLLGVLVELRRIHRKLRMLVEPLSEEEIRRQYHQELSPIGWHLGHCCFIENYWLREIVQGDQSLTASLHDLYFPEQSPKAERGGRIPGKEQLLSETEQQHEQNLLLLSGVAEPLKDHPLLNNNYLPLFLVQHHAQHLETMMMVLTQRAYQLHRHRYHPQKRLLPSPLREDYIEVPGCTYRVGGTMPAGFDNEFPSHTPELKGFSISRFPVTNGEYLSFLEQGGYQAPDFWDEEGWQWLQDKAITQPEDWYQDDRGWWYGVSQQGPYELLADGPVSGISHYEARAFTRYAQARLPHEHEWEVTQNLHALQKSGIVWEWCENTFSPYEGFEPFPYDGYSKPWYDDRHYVLKGGSLYTQPIIRRASFRNFYNPDKRHIFSGIRLAR
jgi:iron(II)-dependent oxidoreductase